MTGMSNRTGSIVLGMDRRHHLVDVSTNSQPPRVDTGILDGYRLQGSALRQASGRTGMPKEPVSRAPE